MPQELLIILAQVGIPLGTLAIGLGIIGRSELGKALIHRLREVHHGANVDDLADEVSGLRMYVAELEERLDFTERVLASNHLTPLPGSEAAPPGSSTEEKVSTPV